MKIKVTEKPYKEVKAIVPGKHEYPVKQSAFIRKLISVLSAAELKETNFTCDDADLKKLSKDEPALFLMNHSSFTDLQIIAKLLKDRQYHIVMTNDGMVGKAGLMKKVGCIPTKKFVSDPVLVKDMIYAVNKLNSSILMYPEASYSFDGTETPLPSSLGKCIKLLKIPVVMIRTKGAFIRDPLYNNLQKRSADVSAKVTYLLSKEDINVKSADEINEILKEAFTYDHFYEQFEDEVIIDEPFRADGLERVLYKCIKCGAEGKMIGKGKSITCMECGDSHDLMPRGNLGRLSEEPKFNFVPEWYAWERECVKNEIESGEYRLDVDVDILMLVDTVSMYKVGSGHLTHTVCGFTLTGCDGELEFTMPANYSYSLYADYFWYEIGDMIAIGDSKAQYYCFPKTYTPVAKARLATEEIYKKVAIKR